MSRSPSSAATRRHSATTPASKSRSGWWPRAGYRGRSCARPSSTSLRDRSSTSSGSGRSLSSPAWSRNRSLHARSPSDSSALPKAHRPGMPRSSAGQKCCGCRRWSRCTRERSAHAARSSSCRSRAVSAARCATGPYSAAQPRTAASRPTTSGWPLSGPAFQVKRRGSGAQGDDRRGDARDQVVGNRLRVGEVH